MTNKYDVIIIGAGPAGSVFAMELSKRNTKLKMALINGQTEENKKPCGGLLAPDAQAELAKLNLTLPKEVLSDPQIFEVETIDIHKRLTRHYQRHYLNMDRYRFDLWLLSLVPNDVDIINGRCISLSNNGSEYVIRLNDGTELNSRYIVGADGGGSIVRKSLFNKPLFQYTSIQQWFKCENGAFPFYSCIFDKKTSDSCSWTICKDEYTVFGGAFKSQGCRKSFDLQKNRFEELRNCSLGEPVFTEACMVSSPRRWRDFICGKNNVFLIGEAAGFISSSSFEGISSAILSGKLLADAFGCGSDTNKIIKLYRRYTLKLRIKLYFKTVKRFILCSPLLRYLIMKSGIRSIKKY